MADLIRLFWGISPGVLLRILDSCFRVGMALREGVKVHTVPPLHRVLLGACLDLEIFRRLGGAKLRSWKQLEDRDTYFLISSGFLMVRLIITLLVSYQLPSLLNSETESRCLSQNPEALKIPELCRWRGIDAEHMLV